MKKKHSMDEIAESLAKREKFWALTEEYKTLDPETLAETMAGHVEYTQGKEKYTSRCIDFYMSLAYSIRDYLIEHSNDTQHHYYQQNAKRVYYLSLEYLMGRTLSNSLINLGALDIARKMLDDFGIDWDEVIDFEPDAGLGNGGLGRLAACFLDSMATLDIPSMGYGIRYDYGIFNQKIIDGYQMELPDQWLKFGNPWEIFRRDYIFEINLYGRVEPYTDEKGNLRFAWVDTRKCLALPYDTPIPGYGTNTVNFLRLWSSKATNEFDLDYFNQGNYMKAVYAKDVTETITKVLYPKDDISMGKELRLIQEYFFVSASVQDIIRRHKVKNESLDNLHEKAAIQLNDTHPAIAIAEIMHILVDKEEMSWERAWSIVSQTFGYTNHTVLPEALERWPVELMERVLPRHLQIIYEINRRHLEEVQQRYPGDNERLSRMSIIEESPVKSVKMANLAVVGSHSVNGVAQLHTQILTSTLLKDFAEMWPKKFNNKTNGITPRRWLMLCNPELAALVTKQIGDTWIKNLDEMKKLKSLADDEGFRKQWMEIKQRNKENLADYIEKTMNISINRLSIFDCQVKRIHEYKRQLLNVLHVITLYNQIRNNPKGSFVPRTVIFSGKAAPGYAMAKLVIKLITSVADKVNNDPAVGDLLKVVYLENYGVTLAEKIMPAADLSEQISTAGMEASGTGNMKFALNGALTIGTLDGANVEIKEEVGEDNIFIFGLNADEVQELRSAGYDPLDEVHRDPRLRECLEMIARGYFSAGNNGLFKPIIDSLLSKGDYFLVLKDYGSYIECQEEVSNAFRDKKRWARASVLNSCQMGKFSSDRTIREYAKEIWNVSPMPIARDRMTEKRIGTAKK
jgi:glycogen phosphorylase